MPTPKEIVGQKYVCLTTFRKNGLGVNTPVWFAEQAGRLYVKTRNDSGKYKRIRNNPRVRVAPCTMRGKITGPEFPAKARIFSARRMEAGATSFESQILAGAAAVLEQQE
jgi:hypothetical protein